MFFNRYKCGVTLPRPFGGQRSISGFRPEKRNFEKTRDSGLSTDSFGAKNLFCDLYNSWVTLPRPNGQRSFSLSICNFFSCLL